jgi:hypothetical protein
MRADLLEAQASIDWPSSQLLSLNARLEEWLKANVHIEIKDLSPPATHNPIGCGEGASAIGVQRRGGCIHQRDTE